MMTLEEQLKNLILSRYKNLSVFAKAADIPYTTVDSMLKRGILKASIGKVIQVCRCLGISADGLADGEIVPYQKTPMELTPAEMGMIEKYRAMDNRGKGNVEVYVEREYRNSLPLEKDSAHVTGAG